MVAGQVGVWDWNIQTNVVHLDSHLKTMLGYEEWELTGRIEAWQRLTHPDDREKVLTSMTDYLEGRSHEYSLEYRMLHKDGSIRWFLTRGIAFRDSDGEPYRMVGTRTDITERKQLELALQESEAKFASAFRSIPDPVMIATLDEGRFIEVNDEFCSVIGYHREEVVGRTVHELNLWVNPTERDELVQIVRETGAVRNYEGNFRTKSGEVLTVLLSAEIIRFSNQPYILIATKDVTERKQIEQQQADLHRQLQTELAERRQTETAMHQLMEREQQVRERERFIATIAQNIRQSLNLDAILTTTVEEVRRFLEVERVVIYRVNPDGNGQVVAESLADESYSIIHETIHDRCFRESMSRPYYHGHVHAINDVLTADLQPCYVELLTRLQVRAILIVPILVQDDPGDY